ncbi:MAG: glucose 1-dehydrogenase [Chloroflexota bacterium]|nr:MAG: glucose 1-dehydrogenase [Chloroflexota bacterium]
MKLDGKVAIVTGAASGIGRASAIEFAREGARVLVCDVDEEGGRQTVATMRAASGTAEFQRADVARGEEVAAMVAAAVRAYGGLDIMFNNAGIIFSGSAVDTTEEQWDRLMGVNLRGVWLGIKHAAPEIRRRGGGAIINTASVHGMATVAGVAAYATSKHAVIGLTRAAALELAPWNIRVNAILPGAIDTALMRSNLRDAGDEEEGFKALSALEPIGRIGRPEEIARAAVFLASDDSSFVTGAPFAVDGGLLAKLM